MKTRTAWAMLAGLLLSIPSSARAQTQVDPSLIAQGAEVYASACGRCHNPRSGSERTDAEWVTIVAHMRARANMPRSRAMAVLAFLQATNVPEGTAAAAPPAPGTEPEPPEARRPGGPGQGPGGR